LKLKFKAIIISVVVLLCSAALALLSTSTKPSSVNAAGYSPVDDEVLMALQILTSTRIDLETIPSENWNTVYNNYSQFKVSTAQGLQIFATYVNSGSDFSGKTVYLSNDIELTSTHVSIGHHDSPFRGTFNGDGNIIELFQVNSYGAGTNRAAGFFGETDKALIMNVEITGQVSAFAANNTRALGGIVGRATDTTIINCINKASMTNGNDLNSNDIAGIVASAKNTIITNCVNYGRIRDSAFVPIAKVGGILANDAGGCEVRICINFGELIGTPGFLALSDGEIREWGTGSVWDVIGNRIDLLKDYNSAIHESKNDKTHSTRHITGDWRYYVYKHCTQGDEGTHPGSCVAALCPGSDCYCSWARFWGFDEYGEINMATPRIYGKSIVPILDMGIDLEFQLKDLAATQIIKSFYDKYCAINSGNSGTALVTEYRILLIIRFGEIMTAAQTRNIHEVDWSDEPITFTNIITGFIFNSETGSETLMKEIFNAWYEENEILRKQASYDIIEHMLLAWYEDCYLFIKGEDELAEKARADLDNLYYSIFNAENALIKKFEPMNSMNMEAELDSFIDEHYAEFDNIYYTWDFAMLHIELEEAFEKTYYAASSKNKSKVQQIYNQAVADIAAAKTQYAKWTERAAIAWEIQDETLSQFDSLMKKWEKQTITTIWVSIICGIISVAGGIVGVLLIIMKKRQKKYASIDLNDNGTIRKKDKQLIERAAIIAEKAQLERQNAELKMHFEREKARMKANAVLERKERDKLEFALINAQAEKEKQEKQDKQEKKEKQEEHEDREEQE